MIMMKYLRISRKLSLREVEKMTGISTSHLSRLENRERCYSGKLMHSLAEFYGVKPEVLTMEHDAVKDESDVFVEITNKHPKEELDRKVTFYSYKYNEVLQLITKLKFEEELEFTKIFLENLIKLQLTNRSRTKIVEKIDEEN